jgi:hypothetical protein
LWAEENRAGMKSGTAQGATIAVSIHPACTRRAVEIS